MGSARVECRICKWKLLSVDMTFVAAFVQLTSFRDVGASFFFLSFSIYCLALAFEHYGRCTFVLSGLQDKSLQVTISKLP